MGSVFEHVAGLRPRSCVTQPKCSSAQKSPFARHAGERERLRLRAGPLRGPRHPFRGSKHDGARSSGRGGRLSTSISSRRGSLPGAARASMTAASLPTWAPTRSTTLSRASGRYLLRDRESRRPPSRAAVCPRPSAADGEMMERQPSLASGRALLQPRRKRPPQVLHSDWLG